MFRGTKLLNVVAIAVILLSVSCVEEKVSLEGNFELEGFIFDVTSPKIELNTPSKYYTNQPNVPLKIITGGALINCEGFTDFGITESPDSPPLSNINRKCQLSGSQNFSYSLKDASEGSKLLYGWGANKSQGTISSPSTIDIVLDLTPPVVSLGSPLAFEKGGSTKTFVISLSDNYLVQTVDIDITKDGGVTWYKLSKPDSKAVSANLSYPMWDTSSAQLRMQVSDAAGNSSTVTSSLFTLDSTPPLASLSDLPTYVSGGSNPTLNFSSSDLNGVSSTVLEYSVDGINWSLIGNNLSSPYSAWTVPTTETSMGRVRLTATDSVGNVTQVSTANFTVDSTPPSLTIDPIPAAILGGVNRNITFNASDTNGVVSATFEYSSDGVTFGAPMAIGTSSPFVWSVPSATTTGSKVRITVVDNAGNSTSVTSNPFNIDITPPTANITDLAGVIKGGASTAVNFSSSDTNGVLNLSLEYSSDGVSYTSIATNPTSPYSWNVPNTDTVSSRLRLTVTDNVGLQTQVVTSLFAIDSTGPSVNITDLASVIQGGGVQSITFSSSDTHGVSDWSIWYAADGTTFNTQIGGSNPTSPLSWNPVPTVDTSGSKLMITATDIVGNTSSVTTSPFNIDSTPPTLGLSNLGAAILGGSVEPISFTKSDLHGVSSWSLSYADDGVTFVDFATNPGSPFSWTVPASNTTGSKIKLTATDSVGNTTSVTNNPFDVDSTPPTASITNLPTPLKGGSSQSVSFSKSDTSGVASWVLEYAADGVTFSTIATNPTSPFNWTLPLVDTTGSKLRLTVTDNVGLQTQVETSVFNIDSTPPTVSISDMASVIRGGIANNISYTYSDINGVANWDIEYASDGVTFTAVASNQVSPYSWVTPVTDTSGSRLKITATDNAGNVNSATTSTFSIDSTPPTLSLDDLSAVILGGSNQSVTFSKSDLHGVATWILEYAADGVTFSNLVTDPVSPYAWSVPSVDTTASTLRLTATDSVGNSTSLTNAAFSIDSTATIPNLSPQNFTSSTPTNAVPLTLTAASCSDIAQIFIQESSTPPLSTDLGWQPCSLVAGALTFDASLTGQQGFRTLRAYGIDSVGNISSPQLINFIFDTSAPIMSFDNIPTLPTGITYPIKWTLTEASIDGTDNFTLEYSTDNGASWNLIANVPVGTNGPHSSKAYSYDWVVPGTVTTQALFKISLTDNTAQTGSAQSNVFSILDDLNAPSLVGGKMTVNGSASPPSTSSKYVSVSLEAIDGDTNVTHFCLKGGATAPTLSDPCWKAVDAPIPGLTPSTTLNLINFPHLLGYVPANYSVYAWAKDLGNNISTNTGTIGKDLVNISYLLDSPPVISNFFASNTTSPPNPITDSEMTFNQSDSVFIKWTANDDKGINPTIELYYTTDDVNFTLISSGLSNSVNNCAQLDDPGTTLDDSSTGCYHWTSPFSSTEYFKLRIVVEDTAAQGTSTLTVPLNSGIFRVLAGNVDPGIDSSAKSAMLNPSGTPSFYSLAVASDGKVFFNDATYGLLYINPQTGILEQLLPVTGTYSGDLGNVRDATAVNIYKITMDYEDRLLIWDGQRIRRVDTKTEPMQIETIIGGYNNGALGTQTTDTITNPADLLISSGPTMADIFQPLPNGDIYFQSSSYRSSINNGNVLRVYRGSLPNPDIQSIRPWGTGAYTTNNGVQLDIPNEKMYGYFVLFDPNTSNISNLLANFYRNIVGCSFYTMAGFDTITYESLGLSTDVPNPHPPTFVSTCGDYYSRVGHDGNLYRLGSNVAWAVKLSRYNPGAQTYTTVFGTGAGGAEGYCPDGTAATSCKIKVQDYFVTASGQIFLLDNGTIRVIDSSGNVQTLYGQTKVYGDGGLAQDARFNLVNEIDHGVDDNVIIYDRNEKVLREIRPNAVGNQVVNLAGNGETGTINFAAPASGQTLNGNSWDQPGAFVTDPTSGEVYFPCVNVYICRLNRSTGLWEQWAGGGATYWYNTGTITAPNMRMGGYNKGILSAYGGKFLTGHYSWSGSAPNNSTLREFNMATGDSIFIAGKTEEDGASGCPDGIGTGCNLNANRSTGRAFTYHTGAGQWLYEHNSNVIKYVSVSGASGSITTFDTMAEGISSMVWNMGSLYYCTDDGVLKRKDYPAMTITTMPFPNSSIECYGYDMLFKPASGGKPDRLVFPFRQNGLTGIAEYLL